jgi:hypothetical protein
MTDSSSDKASAGYGRKFLLPAARRLIGFLHTHRWAVLGGLWAVAYVLGCVGAAKEFAAAGQERSAAEPFYRALQLFIMDDSMVTAGPVASWEWEVARFLAPAAAVSAAVAACLALFHERLQIYRLRFFRQHVVICGLGRKGLALARDFRRHGEKVVVIERDETNEGIATCQQLRIPVLLGDATDRSVLEQSGVAAASHMVAICGEDGTNAEIALLAYRIMQGRSHRSSKTVRGFAHVVELKLCELFSHHRVFADLEDCFEATVFNIYQNSARMLLEEHPPDQGRIVRGDLRTAHVIVLGLGRMGEAVALQLARTGHYASGKKPRLTVVDREADARRRSLYSRYPQFAQVCAAEFVTCDAEDPDMIQKVHRWARDPEAVVTIVVTLDGDARGLSCALSILSHLGDHAVPLVVRMSDDAGLATLLESEVGSAEALAHVHPFGMPSSVCTRRMLNDELDILAKAIHEDYVRRRKLDDESTEDPSTVPWEHLDVSLKESNRQQADHLRVKLRAIGCYGRRGDHAGVAVDSLSDEEVELLAQMEHARWNAERFLGGWRLGEKDNRARTSPYLVDWEELSEPIKEYDRQAVRQIPRLLELIGEKLYRHKSVSPGTTQH